MSQEGKREVKECVEFSPKTISWLEDFFPATESYFECQKLNISLAFF